MKLFEDVKSLQSWRANNKGSQVAFVATMGALHSGHLTLIDIGYEKAETVVVSVFVNPTQFNKSEDLENYPRTLANDLELLSKYKDIVIFHPKVHDIYPEDYSEITLTLGTLEHAMEGEHRPGHFNGVINVVHRLFDIIQPNYACFGEKDFQQLAVIQHMTNTLNLPVEIVSCPTSREESGLALSSRNLRLSDEDKKEALVIFKAMQEAKNKKNSLNPVELRLLLVEMINKSPLHLEYLEFVNPKTLESISKWEVKNRICIAARCGNVRLIDNMEI